jgi:fumarate hydratase, class II
MPRLGKNVPMTQPIDAAPTDNAPTDNGPTDNGPTDNAEHRIEHDTMGEVRVPAKALWKAQTQRAVENFPISGVPINSELIGALGLIKEAAAKTNAKLGILSQEYADAIAKAASEVAENRYDSEFPLDVFQTGSGTSSNMNANEVIASLATAQLDEAVHPNDHVNASQSSNDVFPSAIHIAATYHLVFSLLPALRHLADALSLKANEFAEVVKSGRTHLMDATPVTLGQEFGGYAAQIRHGIERVDAALPRVAELPLGGTAVGTGINTPPGFAESVISMIVEKTGLPLTEARDHFEAQGARDGLVEASGVLRTIAVSLYKIANDVRWMGSGPRAGLGEISLPDLQPGSSIMPGKVNPVICEATMMVCVQVIGNDAAVAFAGASGNFELNVMLPVMARNLLESIQLLANVSRLLADRCVMGIKANVEHCRRLAESSPSIVTPLNRYIGYENAAAVAKQALKEEKTIREVVIENGYISDGRLTEEQLDAALDVLAMTRRPV